MTIERTTALSVERDKEIKRLSKALARLGKQYEDCRLRIAKIREDAEPIIKELAMLDHPQKDIAADFRLSREAIRRMEMTMGVDRGDPRTKPGNRVARPVRKPGRPKVSKEE